MTLLVDDRRNPKWQRTLLYVAVILFENDVNLHFYIDIDLFLYKRDQSSNFTSRQVNYKKKDEINYVLSTDTSDHVNKKCSGCFQNRLVDARIKNKLMLSE